MAVAFSEVMLSARKLVTSRPIFIFLVLAFLVIVFGCIPITIWRRTTKNVTNDIASITEDLRSSLVSEIENIGNFIYQKSSSSTTGLARIIDSYLTNNDTHFKKIQNQIAPVLFQAYSTIPLVSQVAYVSTDGLLFAYKSELNASVAVFADSSSGKGGYTWYTQTVDQITGRPIGNATKSKRLYATHTDWFQAAQRNHTTAFVGPGLGGEVNETLFQRVVSLYSKKGVVSLGFPVKTLIDSLKRLNLQGGELYLWTKEGTLIVPESSPNATFFTSNGSICFGRESSKTLSSRCIPANCSSSGYQVVIGRSELQAFCSVLEVSGVPLRYTLMFPNKESIGSAWIYLLVATMFLGLCWPLGFVAFMVNAAGREMHMRATLINQMEATQQAERKSMNKSQAFARASHDIRGSLAGITGLIDLCHDSEEVRHGSDLETRLKLVNGCTKDLLDLLNTVLDTSKIESGKMQLKEEEFNLAKLVEDVIDFFHPVALKKGVDVVLDMQDGSVFRCSNVRGDDGKLKQILNNLVSNAVKFTVEGHISIRAWARRTSSNVILASDNEGGLSKFSKSIFKKNKDQVSMSTSVRNNGNMMEFVFEVDDTGKGIPMEMRKSVFENYVQARELDQVHQGTGLGLGIVQSLVRLMGGEIRIIDKAMGERGTCFQFNVLLSSASSDSQVSRKDMEEGDHMPWPIKTSLGGSMSIRNMSPRLHNWLSSSPKQERSRVVLLLKDGERRRVTEKYIKSLGIKVTVVEKWEHLNHALERLLGFSRQGSIGRGAECDSLSSSSRELPLIGRDVIDSRSQTPKRTRHGFSSAFLLVIDATTGQFPELYDIVEQFRRGLHHGQSCKVVWLNEPSGGHGSERGDISCSKPLHGSCLNRVLKMLPEFGGTELKEDKKEAFKPSEDELLSGKRVMVVDDTYTTSLVAITKLKKMGASEIKQCYSGKEAVRLVSEWLTQREHGGGSSEMPLPFDYIFMDCQMPEMDGYEATREIRKMEAKYGGGLHVPIIAVSGHDHGSTEAVETKEAGMDAFLEKNLNHDQLAKVIREITSKQGSQSINRIAMEEGAMDAKPSPDSII